ncbi:MAG TPA: hypothetical protein DDW52_04595 [Planctomycetaceae bacterium]|nr:hypothetical protein [Planctomycetaceae bacterium]
MCRCQSPNAARKTAEQPTPCESFHKPLRDLASQTQPGPTKYPDERGATAESLYIAASTPTGISSPLLFQYQHDSPYHLLSRNTSAGGSRFAIHDRILAKGRQRKSKNWKRASKSAMFTIVPLQAGKGTLPIFVSCGARADKRREQMLAWRLSITGTPFSQRPELKQRS